MGNESSASAPALPVLQLGRLAASTLVSGSHGSVIAPTSRAIYLLPESRELLWLTDERSTPHRRCVQSVGTLPRVAPETPFAVVGRWIVMGARPAFDMSDPAVWEPAPAIVPSVLSPKGLGAHLATTVDLLTRGHTPTGIGVLLPKILGLYGHRLPSTDIVVSSPVGLRAWPAIRAIRDAGLAGDLGAALRRAEGLIGLGEGLTPSGDDFVGGFLFSLLRLGRFHVGVLHVNASVVGEFLRAARSRTNVISYTLLADHARGHASEALERFLDSLLTGQHLECTRHRGARLIQVGHSTGWDLLTGVALGILATANGYESRAPVEVSPERLLHF